MSGGVWGVSGSCLGGVRWVSDGCLGSQVVFGRCVSVSGCCLMGDGWCLGVSGGCLVSVLGLLVVSGVCWVVSGGCFRHFFRSGHFVPPPPCVIQESRTPRLIGLKLICA